MQNTHNQNATDPSTIKQMLMQDKINVKLIKKKKKLKKKIITIPQELLV